MRLHTELAWISGCNRKNVMNRRLAMLSLALCAGFGAVAPADAQNYPSRPLRIVVL
ncbi:MAG: hypothetical protein ACXWCY_10155 [Burkholderiales bacterium]